LGDSQASTANPKANVSRIPSTFWDLRITSWKPTREFHGGQEDGEEATKAKHWERAGNNEKNAA